ncbi:hypothetical protein VC83_02518 [Pseudogymnoascus destructans]|uniref:Uncharacterized protein n=1 Tax=Pseudogymnoascus destructans TaxID=655981 RepID=A0A177AGF5_9PEZI|nr:uncharacterized protein VC83_02518 [Pseudogymnoascus destructans]OAF61157.2 hypothetical protein VC83_02518 [Pseudogymnoascus destructans]
MDPSGTQRKSRHTPLTAEAAVTKLLETSKLICSRAWVKQHEGTRIQEAFKLVASSSSKTTSKTDLRRDSYQRFLKMAEVVNGVQAIVLSAVGLGQSAVANMREKERLQLPSEIKKRGEALESPLFQELAGIYSAKVSIEHFDAVPEAQPPGRSQNSEWMNGITSKATGSADHIQGQNDILEAQYVGDQLQQGMHIEGTGNKII